MILTPALWCNHSYTAYSVETNRFGFIGNVSTYDVYDSYLPQYAVAFQKGRAAGAMCSYMSMRVEDADAPATQPAPPAHPNCASEFLLNNMVRKKWGMTDALIVTDWLIAAAIPRDPPDCVDRMCIFRFSRLNQQSRSFSEATASMYQHNHLAVDAADAAAKSINAGVDLNTGYP